MNTDVLIKILSDDVRRVPRFPVARRLLVGLGIGAVVTLLLVVTILGFRPDLAQAVRGTTFWMKWGYTISLGIGALVMTSRLARPEPIGLRRFWPITLPFVALAGLSIAEMARVDPADWLSMWLGETWTKCPWLVMVLAMPIFAGLLWSFRQLAPTRLRIAGATAGLAAGAWGATLYCLHCPEVSPLFVLTWYTLGMLLVAGLGALIGPRVLRW
ncbi:DUF1109 domain-containing protein [Sphingomonas sp. UYP23]